MLGMRHRIRHLAGRGLGLLSMSALLAFACFPVLAQADSSELEYRDAPPPEYEKTPNKNPATPPKTGGPGQSPTSPGSTDDGNSGRKSATDESGGAPAHKGGGGKGGPGPQADRGGKGDKNGGQPKAIDATPTSTEDGGSSPLVPILIALAVLAAISIGAVVMRRRRDSEPGSPVSPGAS
jgi:hypothetical protein